LPKALSIRPPVSRAALFPLVRFSLSDKFIAMNPAFTAIVKKDGDWWIGWIEEVPGVNAQEHTKEKLLGSLKEILREALEFNRSEARQAAENNYTEEAVTV
jgi:predicted RNase H-like HicB family nuclease